jgi:uncharacterized membrane-anchored protein
MRRLFALGVIALVDGTLALANAYGLQLLAVTIVVAGIVVTGMYVWRGQKRHRRHRQWFKEG